MKFSRHYSCLAIVALIMAATPAALSACPFCSGVSLTLAEEIKSNDVAVLATLLEAPAVNDGPVQVGDQVPKARFRIDEILKGADLLGETREIDVLYFGEAAEGTQFLVMGIEPPQFSWSTPLALSEQGVDYVNKLSSVPESGADRLAFFQEFFESDDNILARDAYDEFARAPYAEVKALKDRMHHDQLIVWIQNSDISPSHRRLYLTMLGICGADDDIPMLEELIRSTDRKSKTALDAIIACYLALYGTDGLSLIEDLFLKNADAEYTDTYAAIMALRFHGQEGLLPLPRVVAAMEHMLNRPQLADLIIPDLARWEDWQVMDRLVKLFKEADEESNWIRVPVISFLRACQLPEAQAAIEELAAVDPDAVKRANSMFPLTAVASSEPATEDVPPATGDTPPASDTDSSATGDTPQVGDLAGTTQPTTESDLDSPSEDAPAVADSQPAEKTDAIAAADVPPAAAEEPAAVADAAPAGQSLPERMVLLPVIIVPLVAGLALLALMAFIFWGQRRHSTT